MQFVKSFTYIIVIKECRGGLNIFSLLSKDECDCPIFAISIYVSSISRSENK